MKKQTPIQVVVIETANIKPRSGRSALLIKGWHEESLSLVSIWTDADKPNPFLKGKAVGDTVRVIPEMRQETDINGKKTSVTYYTPIPQLK
jgi:hypothetical protein